MSGNKRIHYGCLGVAYCGEPPIQGATSVSVSLSRNISNIFSFGNSNAIASYANLPDVELSFSSHLVSVSDITSEPGFNSFIGLDILVGPDNNPSGCLVPNQSNRFTQLLLNQISYTMPSQGFFSVKRTYKGWSKNLCSSSVSAPNCPASGVAYRRNNLNLSGTVIPSAISGNPIDNIEVSYSINRQFVNEFATRKPYASYVTYPIETSCTFDLTVIDLDNHELSSVYQACKNSSSGKHNIIIQLCGEGGNGSLSIQNSYLTGLNYSGAEAGTPGNLKLSVTYTGYSTPSGINPVIILDDISDPCACS